MTDDLKAFLRDELESLGQARDVFMYTYGLQFPKIGLPDILRGD
ncbi:MAG: hypothetical protein U5R49_12910 [Deltaproteobacteria bacterium]|nr:hypothetical protein [Deltaproteobacteria bacterium]